MKSRLGKRENLFAEPWSMFEDLTLRRLWAIGKSMTEIGKELGRSRNSVAGRIMRLKITRRGIAEKKRQA